MNVAHHLCKRFSHVKELLLAATSHGLATCPMEGFDMRRMRKALRIPLRYSVPIVVCIGYPSEEQRDFKTLRQAMTHVPCWHAFVVVVIFVVVVGFAMRVEYSRLLYHLSGAGRQVNGAATYDEPL